MTDAEIRKQLEKQFDAEGRSIIVDSPENGPPMLLIHRQCLRPEDMAHLRSVWEDLWRGDHPGPGPKLGLIDGNVSVYQLIGGEWKKLD